MSLPGYAVQFSRVAGLCPGFWTAIILPVNRTAILFFALMCAASIGVVVARPSTKAADLRSAISLETLIPRQFSEWREEPQWIVQAVNTQIQELLDKLYSQILTHTSVNAKGYRIVLSMAYGTDQRGASQAHHRRSLVPVIVEKTT